MSDKRSKRSVRIWCLSIGFILVLCVTVWLANQDSHRTNFNYLVWKQGWSPQTWRRNYHLFQADQSFRDDLKTKTVSDLNKWFPELIPASKGTRQQLEVSSYYPRIKDDEMVWVGDFLQGFKLRGGRFVGIVHFDKG